MPVSSELHIIVPGICGPLAETQSLKNHKGVEQWVQSLSKAKASSSSTSANDVLSEIFNLKIEGDFPSAAFELTGNDLNLIYLSDTTNYNVYKKEFKKDGIIVKLTSSEQKLLDIFLKESRKQTILTNERVLDVTKREDVFM